MLDTPGLSRAEVFSFYREHYPDADGWRPVADQDGLCLLDVDRGSGSYVEVVNVWPYAGGRVDHAPDRYLVALSRMYGEGQDDEETCDLPFGWIPADLFS